MRLPAITVAFWVPNFSIGFKKKELSYKLRFFGKNEYGTNEEQMCVDQKSDKKGFIGP